MSILHRCLAHPTFAGILRRLRAQGRQNSAKGGIHMHSSVYGTTPFLETAQTRRHDGSTLES
eukprot:12284194-Alexandrium_andersonii.AAC.1